MNRIRALGLRARLAFALVLVAVFAVGLATVVANRGLRPRLSHAADARLERSADQLARLAADDFEHHGGWRRSDTEDLEQLAALNGLHVSVDAANGRVFELPAARSSARSDRPLVSRKVVVGGRAVGVVRVGPSSGGVLTPEEIGLRNSLNSLLLVAALVSVAAALVVAFGLAYTLSRSLRRARLAADAMAHGDLSIRVEPGGGAEMRAVGEALNRLAETLEDEETLRKASVQDLAHELRTPVAGLLSRIEAAQDRVLSDDAANLAAMHGEARRLARLLDGLSRLAEAERPGLLLNKRPVELAAIVAQQLDAFSSGFERDGVSLERELRATVVAADDDRLGQIVANLLSNALRYTTPGGTVRVRVRTADGAGLFEVNDTGIGIADDDLPHIFKRFWRAEKSRSRATGGAGIGLAIVRELIEAHDGRVEVESELGVGSTFRVYLPLGDRASATLRRPRSSSLTSP